MARFSLTHALQTYFSDGGSPAVDTYRSIGDGNYRIDFKDGHVSDWRITFDPDTGEVLDATCFNDVM